MDTITGMLICNDRRWPEAFRVLALQGAEIVALGFNTPSENLAFPEAPALRVHHHLITAQAMAYQNAVWLVETAKCGFEDGNRMFGHSLIVAPTGEIAAQSLSEEDEVICVNADLDLAADLKRTVFNFAAHRRPEHYKLIVERVGAEITPAKGPYYNDRHCGARRNPGIEWPPSYLPRGRDTGLRRNDEVIESLSTSTVRPEVSKGERYRSVNVLFVLLYISTNGAFAIATVFPPPSPLCGNARFPWAADRSAAPWIATTPRCSAPPEISSCRRSRECVQSQRR